MAASYSFSQLQALWVKAGGTPGWAPLMAAVALAQSSGRPTAAWDTTTDRTATKGNAGREGATGLWQVEWPLHKTLQQQVSGTTTRTSLYTPVVNAKTAVALFGGGGGASNWTGTINITRWKAAGSPQKPTAAQVRKFGGTTYTTAGGVSGTSIFTIASAIQTGGPVIVDRLLKNLGLKASSSATSSTSTKTAAGFATILGQAQSMVDDTNTLTHGAAVVLDRFFGMFAPSQGQRLGIGAGAVLCTVGGVRAWRSAAAEQGGGSFPLAVGLIGLAVAGAFIALRPWPQRTGKPVKAGAYLVDVFEGTPPAVETPTHSASVTAIQVGLDSVLVLWALGKVASAFSAVTGALRGLNGGGGGGGTGEETAGAGDEAESAAGDAAEGAG